MISLQFKNLSSRITFNKTWKCLHSTNSKKGHYTKYSQLWSHFLFIKRKIGRKKIREHLRQGILVLFCFFLVSMCRKWSSHPSQPQTGSRFIRQNFLPAHQRTPSLEKKSGAWGLRHMNSVYEQCRLGLIFLPFKFTPCNCFDGNRKLKSRKERARET